jgi:hypothetical protein
MAFFWVSGGIYGNEALATAAPAGVIFLLNVVVWAREIGGSGGSPGPLLMHLHAVYTECSECLPGRLNPWRQLGPRWSSRSSTPCPSR